jgi:hypothetical protein
MATPVAQTLSASGCIHCRLFQSAVKKRTNENNRYIKGGGGAEKC